MPTIDEIVSALKTNREEFKMVFLHAQSGLPTPRVAFDAEVREADDQLAFKNALEYARDNNFLDNIIDILINDSLENGSLTKILATEALQHNNNSQLQSITNAVGNFALPDVMYKGIANAMKWTGKVMIDGQPSGTGILIGPHIFITAWHVLRTMFQKEGGKWKKIPGSASRITIGFDDFLTILSRSNSIRNYKSTPIPVHSDWMISCSPCYDTELADKLPDDLTQLNGYWDYVIIRLAEAPGLQRRWAELNPNAIVPRKKDRILLFQHPTGQPLKIDQDEISELDPPNPDVIPRYRFLHKVNSAVGSSGGPCFDKSFMFFGLHQGEWKLGKKKKNFSNRGIPITRILDHIKDEISALPGLDPSENPIWNTSIHPKFIPVLALEDFQSRVWKSVTSGTPKLFIVKGERGRGKTFTLDLFHSMLNDGGDLKIRFSAETFSKLNAKDFAVQLCELAGTTLKTVPPIVDINSTPAAWNKTELLPALVSSLAAARGNRRVWITLADMNKFEITEKLTNEFLLLLVEQLLKLDWLRIIADGYDGEIPVALKEFTETIRVNDLTKKDIENFYRRACSECGFPVVEFTLNADVIEAYDEYDSWLNDDPITAAKNLAGKISKRMGIYLVLNK